jgi:hypothetical protein
MLVQVFHNLVITLESAKLAVEALCNSNATLLLAKTMTFPRTFLYDQQFGHQRFSRLVAGSKSQITCHKREAHK